MSAVPDRLAAALADRYRIERELGAGGMATVYLASDLRHDRQVAIKVLKPELAAVLGADRFVVEIKTTAALSHPHILPLFDSGTADGFLFYVMPYIQGETIREKLNRETQCGIAEAVKIAVDVADALDYAHRHGVIHRDIKPENILLHDGRPVVMDFGIALAVSAAAGGRMTETGLSLGTPHYMSPEQATAEKEITGRSDIYSLGSVLYEMLAGQPPHLGGSAQQIIMKIIAEDVAPVRKLRKAVPTNVAAAVERALEKLPADRFESARAFAEALTNPSFTVLNSALASTPHSDAWKRRLYAAVTACVVLGAAWALTTGTGGAGADLLGPAMHLRLAFPIGDLLAVTPHDYGRNGARPSRPAFVFSPDGASLVYAGERGGVRQLFLRVLAAETATAIAGTEGGESPFFSPDGKSLGFWSRGALRSLTLSGGTPTEIGRIGRILGASWSDDGRIVVGAPNAGLVVFSVGGTTPPDTLAEPGAVLPQFLPGGESLVFTKRRGRELSSRHLEVLSLANGARRILVSDAADGRFVHTGHLVFARRGTLMAVRFDVGKLNVSGSPVVVRDDVMQSLNASNLDLTHGAAQFAVSSTGQLAYLAGGITPDRMSQLIWIDRNGVETAASSAERPYTAARLSPDETRIAAAIGGATPAVQVSDLEGRNPQILVNPGPPSWALWTVDGRRIVRFGTVGDSQSMISSPADGSRPAEPLAPVALTAGPAFWSADGSELFVVSSGRGLLAVTVASGAVRPIRDVPRDVRWPVLSPDGRWLAYGSAEGSGSTDVFVQPWPSLDRKWKVSEGGGQAPVWTRGGRELTYISASVDSDSARTRRMMAVDIGGGDDLVAGPPRELFAALIYATTPIRSHDVTADGSRFLVVRTTPLIAPPGEIHVVVHWLDELKRQMAAQGGAR